MESLSALDAMRAMLAKLDSTDPYYQANRARIESYCITLANMTMAARKEWAEYVPACEREKDRAAAIWRSEHRARKSHECVRRDPYCPGEICPGEMYSREAVRVNGTVVTTKACQACRDLN